MNDLTAEGYDQHSPRKNLFSFSGSVDLDTCYPPAREVDWGF